MVMSVADPLYSAVYVGEVRHRRFVPMSHSFTYPLFMLALDLDEWPALAAQHSLLGERWYHLMRFKRSDFFQYRGKDKNHSKTSHHASNPVDDKPAYDQLPSHLQLKQDVIDNVQAQLVQQGIVTEGSEPPKIARVVLVTHLRIFNFIFNPVSFYYCYDVQNTLVAIQAEITNTPWKERHSYVLSVLPNLQVAGGGAVKYARKGNAASQPKHEFKFHKDFHVSPFNPMNMQYRWVFSDLHDHYVVHMDNTMQVVTQKQTLEESDTIEKHFDATLTLNRQSMAGHEGQKNLRRVLIQYPFMTVKVVVGIYWQAFKLFVKRAPFYSHPKHES